MSTADELLASAFSGEALTVDLANRTIIIPDSVKHLGVTSDEDVVKVLFEMSRFYGDIDLSAFDIKINYKNANGYSDASDAKDIVVSSGDIAFAWLIDRFVVAKSGLVKFSVCLKRPDASESDGIGQELNTQPVALPVLEGLETEESFPEEFPHLYRDLLDRIETAGGAKLATDEEVTAVLEKVYGGDSGSNPSEPSETYKISGKWILNSPVNLTDATITCSITNVNIKTGTAYDVPIISIVAVEDVGVAYAVDASDSGTFMVTDFEGVWTDEKYRYLDFGAGVTASKEFYDWFVATAVQGEYTGSDTPVTPDAPDAPVTPTSYTITNNLTNCTNSNSYSTVAAGGSYVAAISPVESYVLDSVKVLMGGADVTSTVYSNGVINISSVTGDIVITAIASEAYKITNTLTDCTNNNSANAIAKGASYRGDLSAQEGSVIYSVAVTMGGADITNDVYYDGTIILTHVTGDVVITAKACPEDSVTVCSVEFELTSTTCNHLYGKFNMGSSYSNLVHPDDGYALSSVVVTMAGKDVTSMVYSYDEETGIGNINIGCITGDITITAVAVKASNYTLSGAWEMNSSVDIGSSRSSQITATTGTGEAVTTIIAMGTGLFYRINESNVNVAPQSEVGVGTFSNASYRHLDFGTEPQTVSEAFYNWFTSNAVEQ